MVSSSDEKTGVQALSHIKTSAIKPGQPARKDCEYTRNGTTCLIAAKDICTGKISAYSQGETRTESDYLQHVKKIVATKPEAKHVIICDQLNTHKSVSLVTWIAQTIGDTKDLGKKARYGILKSQKSRMEYLENKNHRVRFLYTPKHCSWMNQIENWFGLLQQKVINNGEFESVNKLENDIENFIQYYNSYLAKPFNWKFNGDRYREKFLS